MKPRQNLQSFFCLHSSSSQGGWDDVGGQECKIISRDQNMILPIDDR